MVLSEADVDQLLSSINQLSNERKHLIFTALEPLDSPRNDSGWFLRLYLRFKHESLGWTCGQSKIAAFLKKRHDQTIETVGDFEIARLMMTGILRKRFHRGECIVSAMSDSSRED